MLRDDPLSYLIFFMMMMDWCRFMHNSIESWVFIGSVVYGTDGTVWLDKGILSLDNVTITCFVLWLDIASVEVIDAIFEGVFWRCLYFLITWLGKPMLKELFWCLHNSQRVHLRDVRIRDDRHGRTILWQSAGARSYSAHGRNSDRSCSRVRQGRSRWLMRKRCTGKFYWNFVFVIRIQNSLKVPISN